MRCHGLRHDRAGGGRAQRARVAGAAAFPFGQQRGRSRKIELDAGSRDDDEVREIEQFAPAVPRGKAEKGVGADDQRERARRFLRAQFLERHAPYSSDLAEDFARIDLEPGMAGDGEFDHRETMVGRRDGHPAMRWIAGRDESHRGSGSAA